MSATNDEKKKKHHKSSKKCKDAEHKRICELSEKDRIAEYTEIAEYAWKRTWEILHDTDDWRHDKGTDLNTGTVHSKHFPGEGRCFKLQGYVDCSPAQLFNHLVHNVHEIPLWNPTIVESKVLSSVADDMDIHYTLTKEIAGGLVAKREYITTRHWKTKDGLILSGGVHTSHPDKPPSKKIVRCLKSLKIGENHPGGWGFLPVDGEPNKCLYVWIVNTEFGGWLPQWTIDQALAGEILKCVHFIRDYVAGKQ